ncbi:molybdopterin-guanine dinucleotide biosynthesis protein MobA [Helicobacter pylori]|uniref:relaxase/mobilization nuclease domain-containing protein n=1 Tax=Helicobacter pylori TaxID=210 RepID=UPI000BEAB0D2|nr:relaxase/mobilization nuclease domain-containing protein [Helicobacter pylori]PDX50212.1 molybdopterin-guanine dinucleotide biosynthesis protein MobA [Helicobacter pylori]QTP03537.1 relaxase/mobilization nuclease domain-containing protein [Helicobacter pylori]QTP03542.1 relaxase/mobilization nuclease domain-containing protein [Helicobacter pylori]
MLVKFWGINQGGGDGDGSVNYLLNERVGQGTAKVLKGDANLTKSLLLSLTQKHKACVGCLSFEESNINDGLKYELMESFENALLTQEMQGRYNILWVEHTDKGRLELNFVIPRIDLITQKAFTPYYHSADITRIDLWKDCINLKHNFTNPKNIEKQHNIQQHQTKNPQNKELLETYEKLDKLIRDNLGKLFNSRNDIINFLKSNQCEVTRQGKDYISVKLPNEPKAKRLKGFYYHETFRTIADIREQLSEVRQRESQREHPNNQRDSDNHAELLRELENKLHRYIEYKQQYYKQLHEFNSKEPREPKEQLPRARENQQEIQGNYTRGFTTDKETNLRKFYREPSQENIDTNSNFYRGSSNYGSIDIALSQYHNATNQRTKRVFIKNEKNKTENRGIRAREQSFKGILSTAQERELRESNAERTLKQATERSNQRNRELAERQERVINQARESYSRISNAKQELRELKDRNIKLERELRNAIANTQHAIKEISILRNDRESRIKSSDTNLRTERNHAQKRFTEQVRTDFTTRITERSHQRARDFTSSIQRIENTIRDFRNNAQARARTILHNLYARTRDAINAIKDIYRNAKERIRVFFQTTDEQLSKRMEQETRDIHAKTTQLDRKIREHNQEIENERSYSRGYGR